MKIGKRIATLFMVFTMVCALIVMSGTMVANATGLEDDVFGQQQQNQDNSGGLFDDLKNQNTGDSEDIGDILSGYQPMTSDHLSQASMWASPITNIIGYAMGLIIIVTIMLVGLITALDLMYIAIPPVRNLLYKAGTDGTGAYTGGMGAGGYGMGSYGGRGMGAMGAGGASGGSWKPTQWVSDEAVSCAALLGGSQQSNNMGNMNGMMGANNQPNVRVKSVIWVYFKKRAVAIVLLMVAIMVLTSSALMGTGVNLAQWLLRIIMMFNGKLE